MKYVRASALTHGRFDLLLYKFVVILYKIIKLYG
jgi:hypothetical protein